MARQRIKQWLVAIKRWSDRFFGVEQPDDERNPDYWRGFREGQAAVMPLIGFLARKIPD